MASRRYVIEFVGDDVYDEPRDESVYSSDDEESEAMSSYYHEIAVRESIEERKALKQKQKDEAYKKRITEQLENSGPALEGKLNWCDYKPDITSTVSETEFPSLSNKPEVSEAKQKRFGKGKPMDVPIKFGEQSSVVIKPHTPPPSPVTVESRKYCKFTISQCPFGNRCKFTHDKGYKPANSLTREGKSKKIWMCKNLPNCRFGSQCIYAHTEADVKASASICTAGANCRKVKYLTGIYFNINTVGKCMRLHPRETIKNFINRTA